jgi:hypothetical protein
MPDRESAVTAACERCYDVPRLLQFFESLGENCDLGVVQRAVGLEPFGLLRFAGCDAGGVASLLRARFEPLLVPGDLWLDEVGPRREYWVKSKSSSFEAHTNRYADRDSPTVVLEGEVEKMRYLTAHLLRDLTQGRKLCVFKGNTDLATIREIGAALRAYGPTSLLWVKVADREHETGSVERDSAGLLVGYVSRYGTYDGDPSLPVEDWVAMCANAYRLWRNEEPPKVLCENLISNASAVASCLWAVEPTAETRSFTEVSSAPGMRFEHRLGGDEPTIVCRAQLQISCGGRLTFSTWVRLCEGSQLRQVTLLLPGFSTIASWGADLKSCARWQRMWLAVDIPDAVRTVACDLIATGSAGTVFDSGRWCLERGSRPSGYGFAL